MSGQGEQPSSGGGGKWVLVAVGLLIAYSAGYSSGSGEEPITYNASAPAYSADSTAFTALPAVERAAATEDYAAVDDAESSNAPVEDAEAYADAEYYGYSEDEGVDVAAVTDANGASDLVVNDRAFASPASPSDTSTYSQGAAATAVAATTSTVGPWSQYQPPTSYTYTPPATTSRPVAGCAENGSCYGDISAATGRPKTVAVGGYFRKDGTYVRGHYRSKPGRR